MKLPRWVLLLVLPLLLGACAGLPRPGDLPPPWLAREAQLPPIPFHDGPLEVRVVYPPENRTIAIRGSNFVFGSTGTGRAELTINGIPVRVDPNGAFLAFLPVPTDGVYRLAAVAGQEVAYLERTVRLPPAAPPPQPGVPEIVAGSLFPVGAWTALPGETIEVGFRGTAGGRAALLLPDGSRIPLVERPADRSADAALRTLVEPPAEPGGDPGLSTVASYWGYFAARALRAADPAVALPTLAPLPLDPPAAPGDPMAPLPPDAPAGFGDPTVPPVPDEALAPTVLPAPEAGEATGFSTEPFAHVPETGCPGPPRPPAPYALVELAVGAEITYVPLRLNLALLDPPRLPVGIAYEPEPYPATEGRVRASAAPGSTLHYFWPDAVEVTLTGERAGLYRVRLAGDLEAWIPASQVLLLPEGTPPVRGWVRTVRFTPQPDRIDVRLELDRRFPFRIDSRERILEITVYGAQGDTEWLMYGGVDPYLRTAWWSQPLEGVYRLTLELSEPVWGYSSRWTAKGDLIVGVRRPPTIDSRRPLRGLTVALDPGHPPGGAVGPTGLTEAEANLALALRLRRLLERAGARVVLTRTDASPVGLYERVQAAELAEAHLFVSLHNNAFPDGIDPFANDGTSTYYFHRHSADLARDLQSELLRELGLRDGGVVRTSFAVVRRMEWMPAALTESVYMMIPQQEAALRDPAVQERIARAHLRGIEAFLRSRAAAR